MKLDELLECIGCDTVVMPLLETKRTGHGEFQFSKYSGDKRHQRDYNEYSINANGVIPHGLIDVIKVKNEGLLGEHERGGQSSFAGLNGNIKRYIKKLSALTRGDGDLGWDGGNVSKAMINLLQDAVSEYVKNGEYLSTFKWDRLIREYSSLINRYVEGEDIGALPPKVKSMLPTGEEGASLGEYVSYLIIRDVIAPKFAMKRKLNTEEEVNKYKARVEKLGFLSDVDDTGGFKGMYDQEQQLPATPPQAIDPFAL